VFVWELYQSFESWASGKDDIARRFPLRVLLETIIEKRRVSIAPSAIVLG
jgi:hypothetical protein